MKAAKGLGGGCATLADALGSRDATGDRAVGGEVDAGFKPGRLGAGTRPEVAGLWARIEAGHLACARVATEQISAGDGESDYADPR